MEYGEYYIKQEWNDMLELWDMTIWKHGFFFMHCSNEAYIGVDTIGNFIEAIEAITEET